VNKKIIPSLLQSLSPLLKLTAKIENPSACFAHTEGLLYEMAGWVYEMRFW